MRRLRNSTSRDWRFSWCAWPINENKTKTSKTSPLSSLATRRFPSSFSACVSFIFVQPIRAILTVVPCSMLSFFDLPNCAECIFVWLTARLPIYEVPHAFLASKHAHSMILRQISECKKTERSRKNSTATEMCYATLITTAGRAT